MSLPDRKNPRVGAFIFIFHTGNAITYQPPRHPAGVAALPAMSMPALAGDDAELIAIGEKMNPLWSPAFEARATSNEEWERMREVAGRKDEMAYRMMSLEERNQRWAEAKEKTNYEATYDRMNELDTRLHPYCEQALVLHASTVVGVGVQAAAALYLSDGGLDYCHVAVWKFLALLAERAGFEIDWSEDANDPASA
jgi:hypothetical protein